MAEYRYKSRETIPQGRDTTYTGARKYSDGRRKPDFPEGYQDHVGRPVVVEGYITKTETIVEQVLVPNEAGYRKSSPTKDGLVKDYGVVNNERSRPISPSRDQAPQVEYQRRVQTDAIRPNKPILVSSFQWHPAPGSYAHGGTNNYGWKSDPGTNEWNRPSGNTLTKSTNDNKETKTPSSGTVAPTQRRSAGLTSMVPNIIDSAEAAWKYRGQVLEE